ncbi:hypothetical protein BD324DRAFT_37987 [Kockovaella imperatae]|uniref:Uncharacterized protein n=1 Tax=Kockovaella imperatae TaxID=4999 RepID=A0A1Y1USV5_9TREE|nr:hypothetical protein BD324DRAFT_37987 [Kockovaella imperatae]ORX41091.1 hypothetical protein BD324DRAFT_37987 [Kockovaella imperatae]
MSRRREAADLARALALSTQESTTQDRREMELLASMDPRTEASIVSGVQQQALIVNQANSSASGPSPILSFSPQVTVPPSSVLAPSSNSGTNSARPPRSSPIYPIPSSRLSTTEKSRSSGSSSHRPIFSPTQTSEERPPGSHRPATPTQNMPSHRPQAGPSRPLREIVLSPSPPAIRQTGHDLSSDHEEEDSA